MCNIIYKYSFSSCGICDSLWVFLADEHFESLLSAFCQSSWWQGLLQNNHRWIMRCWELCVQGKKVFNWVCMQPFFFPPLTDALWICAVSDYVCTVVCLPSTGEWDWGVRIATWDRQPSAVLIATSSCVILNGVFSGFFFFFLIEVYAHCMSGAHPPALPIKAVPNSHQL